MKYNISTIFFSSLQSRQSCRCERPRLNIKLVWPVNSHKATLLFSLLVAKSYSALLPRGSFTQQRLRLAATITGLPPVQVLLSQMPPDDFFAKSKWTPTEVVINGSKNMQYLRL